eukprot:CAMPEP_0179010708 /NCGR_PEP_ID=MMETSP0796-20121207/267_1 /TAXON_ID=73915 /ORGANISM="Pyrodinium bahamense, Strain pbaha01" /LENGTH=39 /DNA_ID= /DNA_START= /DNA_END= /DNA_ORIENTATION=
MFMMKFLSTPSNRDSDVSPSPRTEVWQGKDPNPRAGKAR